MTGCISLLHADPGESQPLDHSVYQIPGDTEAIRSLRFAANEGRASCVLVVEKDSVFRRLVDDRFIERLPCVLITGCGFPDLATRALVQRVAEALDVRCFCLTDYNPHGMALMLAYKHGTDSLALERDACTPSMRWLGLRAADVRRSAAAASSGGAGGGGGGGGARSTSAPPPSSAVGRALPDDAFQAFSSRDSAVLAGLVRPAEPRTAPHSPPCIPCAVRPWSCCTVKALRGASSRAGAPAARLPLAEPDGRARGDAARARQGDCMRMNAIEGE